MTFEDWFEDKFKFPYDPENEAFKNIFNVEKVEGMRIGWSAAKEDSKEVVTVEWSDLVGDWSVRDFRGAAIADGFTSHPAAVRWAEFKGYKVE